MGSISAVHAIPDPVVIDMQGRIARVEDNVVKARSDAAERDTKLALLSADVASIKEDVGNISRGLNKVLWTIVCAFLTTAVGIITTFVITGGLELIQ